MAYEILRNAIFEYMDPIFVEAGIFIRGNDGVLCNAVTGCPLLAPNPKFDKDPTAPQYVNHVVLTSDEMYMELRNAPNMKLFNPFGNLTQLYGVLLRLATEVTTRHYLAEHSSEDCDELTSEQLSEINTKTAVGYTDNHDGTFTVSIVWMESAIAPVNLMTITDDDLFKAIFHACLSACVQLNPKFTYCKKTGADVINPVNIAKWWKKIVAVNNKWDTVKKTIRETVKAIESANTELSINDIVFDDGTFESESKMAYIPAGDTKAEQFEQLKWFLRASGDYDAEARIDIDHFNQSETEIVPDSNIQAPVVQDSILPAEANIAVDDIIETPTEPKPVETKPANSKLALLTKLAKNKQSTQQQQPNVGWGNNFGGYPQFGYQPQQNPLDNMYLGGTDCRY